MKLIDQYNQTGEESYIDAEDDALLAIGHHMAKARKHLKAVHAAMDALKSEGMYNGVPTESWDSKTKDGEKTYLDMVFRSDGRGFQGPNGVRKLAIGRDADKIAAARGMVERRQRFNELESVATRLESWIRSKHEEILRLERLAYDWPKDHKTYQGTEAAQACADGVPCETAAR